MEPVKETSSRDNENRKMVKLVQSTEAEASSHQPKRRGRNAEFTPEERRARKRACDNRRYHKTQATLRQIKFLKKTNANLAFENRRLKSRIAAVARDIVKNHLMDIDIRIEKFVRGEVEEDNFLGNMDIPMDYPYLDCEENRSMVLGPSKHISNGVPGMSNQEIMAKVEKMRELCEELNSRVAAIETDKSKDAEK